MSDKVDYFKNSITIFSDCYLQTSQSFDNEVSLETPQLIGPFQNGNLIKRLRGISINLEFYISVFSLA